MTTSLSLTHSLLILSLAGAYPAAALAVVSAGVAQFVAGDVNVRGDDGQTRPLTKGRDIESGQVIFTGATGRAQVKFTDGGLVSLQPNTEFKIDSYIDKADANEDRFLVRLLSGSMRAVTGLIGKRNRSNYRVFISTSTLGIRGSSYRASLNPNGSVTVTAEKDGIEVCNAGVCVGLVAGESVVVSSGTNPPVRTINRASLPTPGPAQQDQVVGNNTTANGLLASLSPSARVSVPPNGVGLTGFMTLANYNPTAGLPPTFDAAFTTAPHNFTNGLLTNFSSNFNVYSVGASAATESGSVGSIADTDSMGWGSWSLADRFDLFLSSTFPESRLHYVTGMPTPVMPTIGSASYNFIGGTAPTLFNGAVGTISSASSLSANFATGSVSANIITSFGTVSGTATTSGNTFSTGSGDITGFFGGPNARNAGLVYYGFNVGASGYYSGAVVFQRP